MEKASRHFQYQRPTCCGAQPSTRKKLHHLALPGRKDGITQHACLQLAFLHSGNHTSAGQPALTKATQQL